MIKMTKFIFTFISFILFFFFYKYLLKNVIIYMGTFY